MTENTDSQTEEIFLNNFAERMYPWSIEFLIDWKYNIQKFILKHIFDNFSVNEIKTKINQTYDELKEYVSENKMLLNELSTYNDKDLQNELLRLYNYIRNDNIKEYSEMINVLKENFDLIQNYLFKKIGKVITR